MRDAHAIVPTPPQYQRPPALASRVTWSRAARACDGHLDPGWRLYRLVDRLFDSFSSPPTLVDKFICNELNSSQLYELTLFSYRKSLSMLPDEKCRANAMPCHAQPSMCAFAYFLLPKNSRIISLRSGPRTRTGPITTP